MRNEKTPKIVVYFQLTSASLTSRTAKRNRMTYHGKLQGDASDCLPMFLSSTFSINANLFYEFRLFPNPNEKS
ncbi:hypothetical protein PHET_06691 [Paragonimus heterotremus]|uniref:Uncharacterized protein n=1 Tax=Paragonimus heterotremus TaxID=100268 RepID=A0A8J4SYE9_9TREM|nr:hypothetical protein PHET_06691 [Paragonimus heterotremus]